MAKNVRGLTVPADNEGIDYRAINHLADSINDITRVANNTQRDQLVADLTAAGLPTNGIMIFNEADNGYYVRARDRWERVYAPGAQPFATAVGIATITLSATNAGTTAVAFPSGRFTEPPTVIVSRASGGAAKYVPYSTSVTATGMNIGVYSGDGSSGSQNAVIAWWAIQMEG